MSEAASISQHAAQVREAFAAKFGTPPQWVAAAPGRVNLIGEHTDYNEGFVLPMAIERQTLLAAAPAAGKQWTVASTAFDQPATFTPRADLAPVEPAWANYIAGVAAGYAGRGAELPPVNVLVDSNIPTGGGLSSSAALEVATATLIEAATGQTLEPVARALLCQAAEHQFAGVPCGIMDQFIVTLAEPGSATLIDCRSHATRTVPMADDDIAVLIANTNVAHSLADGAYGQRRAECEAAARALGVDSLRDATMEQVIAAAEDEDELPLQRARHVVSENERTLTMADALADGDWLEAGRLMLASHASLRDDFEVSCDELDLMVALACEHRDAGVFGSRMTGGGFGGCTVTLLRTSAVETVSRHIAAGYHQQTGIEPALFATRPAAGARMLR